MNSTTTTTKAGRWTKGSYRIAVNPNLTGIAGQCEGYIRQPFGIERGTWRVTHIPSGYAMPGYFNRLADAKRYVEAIFSLTNWERVTPDNCRNTIAPFKNQIIAAMNT